MEWHSCSFVDRETSGHPYQAAQGRSGDARVFRVEPAAP